MSNTVLVVEDDVELGEMICAFLRDEGFIVQHTDNGLNAVDIILQQSPDIVLLDIMLPGLQGIDVAKQVRPEFGGVIIMLTAKDDDFTEVNSLNRGADAFLEKPVRPHILLAHIKAQLRRQINPINIDSQESDGLGLRLDARKREIYLNNELMSLTSAEFELLAYFLERPDKIITRDDLYKDLKNIEYDGIDRSMDMRISTLRKKLDDESPPYCYIKTIRSKGYMLAQ